MDLTDFARRIRRRSILAATLFFGGAAMLIVDFTTRFPTAEKGEFAGLWIVTAAVGLYFYYQSLELPEKEILALAESRQGLLSVSEISTALRIKPDLAIRTLQHLHRAGLAAPRWEELQKNLWEFPDYLELPIAETIDLAQKKMGKVSLQDLMREGHSADIARQTLDTLEQKGLAQRDAGDNFLFQRE